jgi:uncharacterized membrane protein
MPITLSPQPWPPGASQVNAAVFGQNVWVEAAGSLDSALDRTPALRWVMKRNCSISPAQLLAVYLSLCFVSLLIAGSFYFHGAKPVLVFAGVELLALGVALLLYARHAGDQETLTLAGRSLQVEQQDGSRTRRAEFRAEWLAVEPSAGQGSLVELSGDGRRMRVGRFLRPELRAAFAQELRRALRRACLVLPHPDHREPNSQEP